MGGKFNFIIGIVASTLLYLNDNIVLLWISIGVTIILLWSWGVMHNFAYSSAKYRRDRIVENKRNEGTSNEEINRVNSIPITITKYDIEVVPNYLSLINMIATITALVLLIIGVIQIFS